MKKRYFIKFSAAIYVIAGLAGAILLAACLLNIFKIAGVGKLNTTHLWLDITAIVISAIAIAAIVLTLLSRYVLGDKEIRCIECVISTKIPYEKISDIIVDDEKKIFALAGSDEKNNAILISVNISKKYRDEFVKNIMSKNPNITYNICGGDNEKKDESRNSEQ